MYLFSFRLVFLALILSFFFTVLRVLAAVGYFLIKMKLNKLRFSYLFRETSSYGTQVKLSYYPPIYFPLF